MTDDTTHTSIGAEAALAQLVAAVDAETDPAWDCASYHPALWRALEVARAVLAREAQPDVQDTARLEFLIRERVCVDSDVTYCDGYWLANASESDLIKVQIGSYPSPRAAIDAARAAKEG